MLKSGKGKLDDLMAWFGGNYVISAASKNKDLGVKYLMLYAERFPVLAWEKQAAFPAQKVAAAGLRHGRVPRRCSRSWPTPRPPAVPPSLDLSTPQFKEDHQNFIRELCSGLITPEEFCKKLDASAEKASKQK